MFEQLYGVALNSEPVFVLTANSYLVKGPHTGGGESLFLFSWLYKTCLNGREMTPHPHRRSAYPGLGRGGRNDSVFFFILNVFLWLVGICVLNNRWILSFLFM